MKNALLTTLLITGVVGSFHYSAAQESLKKGNPPMRLTEGGGNVGGGNGGSDGAIDSSWSQEYKAILDNALSEGIRKFAEGEKATALIFLKAGLVNSIGAVPADQVEYLYSYKLMTRALVYTSAIQGVTLNVLPSERADVEVELYKRLYTAILKHINFYEYPRMNNFISSHSGRYPRTAEDYAEIRYERDLLKIASSQIDFLKDELLNFDRTNRRYYGQWDSALYLHVAELLLPDLKSDLANSMYAAQAKSISEKIDLIANNIKGFNADDRLLYSGAEQAVQATVASIIEVQKQIDAIFCDSK